MERMRRGTIGRGPDGFHVGRRGREGEGGRRRRRRGSKGEGRSRRALERSERGCGGEVGTSRMGGEGERERILIQEGAEGGSTREGEGGEKGWQAVEEGVFWGWDDIHDEDGSVGVHAKTVAEDNDCPRDGSKGEVGKVGRNCLVAGR